MPRSNIPPLRPYDLLRDSPLTPRPYSKWEKAFNGILTVVTVVAGIISVIFLILVALVTFFFLFAFQGYC